MRIYRGAKPKTRKPVIEIVLDGWLGKLWAAPLHQRGFSQALPFITLVWYGLRVGAEPYPTLRFHELEGHVVGQIESGPWWRRWWWCFWLRYFAECAWELVLLVRERGLGVVRHPLDLASEVYHANCYEQEAYALEARYAGRLPEWAAYPLGLPPGGSAGAPGAGV